MAKPSSIPVAKSKRRRARTTIPTIISFILAPPDSHDIKDKYKTLDEATDSHSVSDWVKGYL